VANYGTICHVLPTINEMSSTLVISEDRMHYCNMHSESFAVFLEDIYRILHRR